MSLRSRMEADLHSVFLKENEFADKLTIEYDGDVYTDVPVILTDGDRSDSKATANGHTAARKQTNDDMMTGLHQISRVMHASIADFGGNRLERGQRVKIYDKDGYIREYYVVDCQDQRGMMRVSLGRFDEREISSYML